MSFLYPTFLWALAAVLIPVIIHLFSFRRYKTVMFSQTRFLEAVRQDNRSRSKLKHLLILLSRMLMIAALVFAFAGPIILADDADSTGNQTPYVAVYIDNSYSMMNESEQGSMLDLAKQTALNIAEAHGSGVEYLLLTNAMPAAYYRPMSVDEFIESLGKITHTSTVKSFSDISTRAESIVSGLVDADEQVKLYFISDFQENAADINTLKNTKHLQYAFMQLAPLMQENLSVDSLWFDTPFRRSGQAERLYVSVKNHGESAYSDVPLNLFVNDSLKAVSSFSVAEQSEAIVEINFTNALDGLQEGHIVFDDYPVQFDNTFYFNYQLSGTHKIMIVEGNSSHGFPRGLYNDEQVFDVDYVALDALNLNQLASYDLVIIYAANRISDGLQSQLDSYLQESGVLCLIPDENADIVSWNQLLTSFQAAELSEWTDSIRNIYQIDFEHDFFRGVFPEAQEQVDLPNITGSWRLNQRVRMQSEPLISFRDGGDFLLQVKRGNGFVYMLTSLIHEEYGNFNRHALLIPVVYNIALNIPGQHALYHISGEEGHLDISNQEIAREANIEIVGEEMSIIPIWRFTGKSLRVFIPEEIADAGHYRITRADETIAGLAINHDASESEMQFLNSERIESLISEYDLDVDYFVAGSFEKLQQSIQNIAVGKKLWHWFLLAALVFIIIEIALIRFMRD
ncbi:MAG: BatA domain-containing protein [Bacteroidota bacterium]|nr:BatA domain-containing protein [Bacteroidota bacterium]